MSINLIFLYTVTPNVKPETQFDSRRVLLPVPDEILEQPDIQEKVKSLAQQISQLTTKPFHLSCRSIGFQNYPFIDGKSNTIPLRNHFAMMVIRFERSVGKRIHKREIAIPAPIYAPPPYNYPTRASAYKDGQHIRRIAKVKSKPLRAEVLNSLEMRLVRKLVWSDQTPEQKLFVEQIKSVADLYLNLINLEQVAEYITKWEFIGFNPSWEDEIALRTHRRWNAEQARLERQSRTDSTTTD